jgi:pyruvate dehydrogenase E1 component beta subunit
MKKDKKIILFGEGIDDAAAMFGTTKGLTKIFGKNRVFEMPLSENCIVGAAVGASLLGDKVIVNFQRVEF